MRLIAKKLFRFNGVIYNIGDEVKVNNGTELNKLNEGGYIEPLTIKEIKNFGKEEPKKENKKINKEEE